jgi:hypothetical protein
MQEVWGSNPLSVVRPVRIALAQFEERRTARSRVGAAVEESGNGS